MNLIHSIIKWSSLAALVLTVLILGGYPNWVAGPATALFCALGVAHLLLSMLKGSAFLNVERMTGILALAVVFWLTALVGYDCLLGVDGGRIPSVSARQIPYAYAFFSALLLGSQFKTLSDKRAILWTLTCLGVVIATCSLIEKFGWDIKRFGSSDAANRLRPSGNLLNPNRAAVMMALCLSATLALLASAVFVRARDEKSAARVRAEQLALIVFSLITVGGLVYTLSRLAILCFGISLCVVTWIWTATNSKRVSRDEFDAMPLGERAQRVVFIGLPLVVLAGWVALTLGFGGQGLNERLREIEKGDGRFSVLRVALPLLIKQPWTGVGLGGFDSSFTKYQPADLEGRWNELHWDCFQTAIEAGWPTLLMLLALSAAWTRAWWGLVREVTERSHVSEAWVLRLIPWAGCATVLMCSVGDFPMREPGVAFSFFFLATIIARREEEKALERPNTGAGAAAGQFKSRMLAVPLMALLVMGSVVAGRNGLACARSPWLGQFGFPPSPGLIPNAWESAIAIDPGDPQFHYFLAQAANHNVHAASEIYEKGMTHAKVAMKLKPNDYLIPWSASALAEKLGKLDESDALMRRAIELYPASLPLHRDRGLFFLRQWVQTGLMGSMKREEGVQKAVEEFRLVIASSQSDVEQVKRWMLAAGCLPEEICQLWPGNEPRECLLRAKFLADQGLWESVGAAIRPLESLQLEAGSFESIWYHTFSGIIDFQRREDASAIVHWEKVFGIGQAEVRSPASSYREKFAAAAYMALTAQGMGADRIEFVSVRLASKLREFQDFSYVLASRLSQSGRLVAAERLLRETAGTSAALNQQRALVSLQLNDEAGAAEHAFNALRYSGQDSGYSKWYEEFMLEVDLRKRKRKGHIQQ